MLHGCRVTRQWNGPRVMLALRRRLVDLDADMTEGMQHSRNKIDMRSSHCMLHERTRMLSAGHSDTHAPTMERMHTAVVTRTSRLRITERPRHSTVAAHVVSLIDRCDGTVVEASCLALLSAEGAPPAAPALSASQHFTIHHSVRKALICAASYSSTQLQQSIPMVYETHSHEHDMLTLSLSLFTDHLPPCHRW